MAFGETVEEALGLVEKVEALARLYWQVLQIGEPVPLGEVEMNNVVGKFKGYGR